MLRLAQRPALRCAASAHRRAALPARRALSDAAPKPSSSSPLAGDTGKKATHLHHHMTTFLAAATPLYLLAPDSYTDGMLDKSFGLILASAMAGHSWIGMNYVATDYVPKISKALLGPARVFNAALGAVTFLGAGENCVQWEGGDQGGGEGVVAAGGEAVGMRGKVGLQLQVFLGGGRRNYRDGPWGGMECWWRMKYEIQLWI